MRINRATSRKLKRIIFVDIENPNNMKYLVIPLILMAGFVQAQSTFKSLQDFQLEYDFEIETTPINLNLQDPIFSINQNHSSDVKMFAPQAYNLSNYPMRDLSKMDDLLMGTALSNTLQLGRQKIETVYIFDLNGNFRSHQTSFPIGK